MITIFTIPKPFTDPHISMIQKNAIRSWLALKDDNQIVLVGNDKGVKEFANELNVEHIPNVKTNKFNTPLLDSAFALIKEKTQNDIIVYVNADIVFLNDFVEALKHVPSYEFLAVGRRVDLDITELIDFKGSSYEDYLTKKARKYGTLHSPSGVDYFVFRKKSFENIPSFAVGRIGWDIWMVSEVRERKIPLIDMTDSVLAIHQNHDYPDMNKGTERKSNPEAVSNLSHIKDRPYIFNIADSTWKITKNGLSKKHFYWYPKMKFMLKKLFLSK